MFYITLQEVTAVDVCGNTLRFSDMTLQKHFNQKCVVHCQHGFCIDFTGIWIPKKHDSWTIIGHLNVRIEARGKIL